MWGEFQSTCTKVHFVFQLHSMQPATNHKVCWLADWWYCPRSAWDEAEQELLLPPAKLVLDIPWNESLLPHACATDPWWPAPRTRQQTGWTTPSFSLHFPTSRCERSNWAQVDLLSCRCVCPGGGVVIIISGLSIRQKFHLHTSFESDVRWSPCHADKLATCGNFPYVSQWNQVAHSLHFLRGQKPIKHIGCFILQNRLVMSLQRTNNLWQLTLTPSSGR